MFSIMPPDYNAAGETEEERKRREAEEAAKAAEVAGPAEPGPVKQTISYDPVTGEQRMKIEGSVKDLSPENALTPTVTMPGQMPEPTQAVAPVAPPQPELQKQFEQPAPTPVAQPAPQPAAETAPAVPEPTQSPTAQQLPQGVKMVNGKLQLAPTEPAVPAEAAQQAPQMPPMPQPGPGVQVAGPAQMPPQPTATPTAPTPAAAPAPTATSNVGKMWEEAGQDPTKFLAMRNDTNLPPEIRKAAGREASRLALMEGDRGEQEAAVKEKMQAAVASGNFNELAKMMKTKSEEGSWGRRILYGMLGMEAAVKDEEAKLGIGAKWQSTTVTDPKTGETKNVLVKTRADGLPTEGYDADTGAKLDARALASVPVGGNKLNIVGGTYINDATKEVGRVVTDEKTGVSYIQTDKGRKPMTGFRPQSSLGSLEDQRARQIQQLNLQLQGKTMEEKMAILRPYNQQLVANGHAAIDPSEVGITAPQIGGGAPAPAVPAAPAPTAMPTPAPAAPAAATRPGPVSPAQVAQQQATATPPAPVPAVRPGASALPGSVAPGARPTATAMDLAKEAGKERIQIEGAVEKERRTPGAQATGKQEAKVIQQQAFADNAYPIVSQLNTMIQKSTGSGIGAKIDDLTRVIGVGTKGSQAIKEIETFAAPLVSMVPRFEGSQSDRDVQMYQKQAGDFANPKLTDVERLAALQGMIRLMKIYDKQGNNDWNALGSSKGEIKIIKREKVQ